MKICCINISACYSSLPGGDRLEVVPLADGAAIARDLHLALEADSHGPQLRQLLTAAGLLGVELSQAALGQADELGVLVGQVVFGGLAADVALRQALHGEADLLVLLHDGVLQDGAGAGLGSERPVDLSNDEEYSN